MSLTQLSLIGIGIRNATCRATFDIRVLRVSILKFVFVDETDKIEQGARHVLRILRRFIYRGGIHDFLFPYTAEYHRRPRGNAATSGWKEIASIGSQ